MPARAVIEERLRELAAKGGLARSACSNALIECIAPLLASGVVAWKRSGAGQRLAVRNPVLLEAFISREFPHTSRECEHDVHRVQGVARFRDSKALANDLPEIVCVRGWKDGGICCEGKPVRLAEGTRAFGVFAFVLADPARYSVNGRCALIENPAVFSQIERVNPAIDVALLARGRCSNALLDWLEEQSWLELFHMPDYDPVGLREFERLRQRFGDRVSLYLPPNLQHLFSRYASPQLLLNPTAQTLLGALRNTEIAEVAQVVALIDQHNGGLEQEALLIAPS